MQSYLFYSWVVERISLRLFLILFSLLLLSGCATYATVSNREKVTDSIAASYSIQNTVGTQRSGEVTLVLAFSGGGSRAAALAYGVLEELRDTIITIDGRSRRLLDEVDVISSVSGGSFTAAYFGLYGDRIFSDFEQAFIRQNITGKLVNGLFSPALWSLAEDGLRWQSCSLRRAYSRVQPSPICSAVRGH